MNSKFIAVICLMIADAIKLQSVQGLQCFVCDDCNAYEDLKELQYCGELPSMTTLMPTNAPDTSTANPTTTLNVAITTLRPLGTNGGANINQNEGASGINQLTTLQSPENTVVAQTFSTTLNAQINENQSSIGSTAMPVLAVTLLSANNATNLNSTFLNGVQSNMGSTLQPIMGISIQNNTTNLDPAAVNVSSSNIKTTLQPDLGVSFPSTLQSGNNVSALMNGVSSNMGSTLQPVMAGNIQNNVNSSNSTIVNGVISSIQPSIQPSLQPSLQQPVLGDSNPNTLQSGNNLPNLDPGVLSGGQSNIASTLQPVQAANVTANLPPGSAIPSSLPSGGNLTNSVSGTVTALKPAQQPVDYDYLEYEDPNATVVSRLSRAAGKVNGPACYMFRYQANNTVFTKRGCTNSINGNSYLTCQSLYNGHPMSGCRICNTDGCNKYDYEEGGEEPIYSAGFMLPISSLMVSVLSLVASTVL